MPFEITGKVIEISPVNQVSEKFRKREFVIEKKETGSNAGLFIDYIKFQLTQDRCDIINESFMNEEVKVVFNIKGNRWERDGKVNYFTNLDAWKIERSPSDRPPSQGSQQAPSPQRFEEASQDITEIDDLPF
ncbi:MAG TPA: DUF3127 domain-containing protein [Bacteroidales bacterium]|jgi:hypothetical protein|nr:DUF3127 domain-containing protein [Bacteroidales bacterium]